MKFIYVWHICLFRIIFHYFALYLWRNFQCRKTKSNLFLDGARQIGWSDVAAFYSFFNKVRERNIRITFSNEREKKQPFATNSIGYNILPDIKASLGVFVQND